MRLDPLDEQIVARLLDDGRASFADIGAQVGLSAPAVKRRVDRLRQAGAITGFTAKVDPRALGWTTEAYVELYCQGKTSPATIRDGIARFPEVVSACTLTGEADALVHVLAADIGHFERVLERMNAEPYVVRTKSSLVLSRLLERPGLTCLG
ncbi:AsnC family transcriptional regulator [Actinopolymorpha pittospori]|uniref:DNA-binding Lrp family transcriptional regulator n=1 Tax=Actinopolymorpha pittospori TaxID=648752 RepID=A0A927RP56_9ACTN|nr:DNA-binding Lrp family transcriptional regulator [Actinopolymorpha pittospori]